MEERIVVLGGVLLVVAGVSTRVLVVIAVGVRVVQGRGRQGAGFDSCAESFSAQFAAG